MIDLIWNLFQQGQIQQSRSSDLIQDEKLKGHKNDLNTLSTRLKDLEKRHEQLKLVTLAMWSLLRDHSGLMESDLRKYVEKVDLMDGKRDGKASTSKERVNCSGCGRYILNTAVICAYCGTYNNVKPFNGA